MTTTRAKATNVVTNAAVKPPLLLLLPDDDDDDENNHELGQVVDDQVEDVSDLAVFET